MKQIIIAICFVVALYFSIPNNILTQVDNTQVTGQSISEIQKQAEQGDAQAQYLLGIAYYRGEGISQNIDKAAPWFQKSAVQGHAEAQYMLGMELAYRAAYLAVLIPVTGLPLIGGFPEELRKVLYDRKAQYERDSLKWIQKAAEQGYPDSQHKLSDWYQFILCLVALVGFGLYSKRRRQRQP